MKDLEKLEAELSANISYCCYLAGMYTENDVKCLETLIWHIETAVRDRDEADRDDLPDYYFIALGVKDYGGDLDYYKKCCKKFDEYMQGQRIDEDLDDYFNKGEDKMPNERLKETDEMIERLKNGEDIGGYTSVEEMMNSLNDKGDRNE